MAEQVQGGGEEGAMAAPEEDRSPELAFSFMDKVRFMMYGEQEKEAFLIEKKEKEEKKKAKKAEKLRREAEKNKKKEILSSGKVEEPDSSSKNQSPDGKTGNAGDSKGNL